MQVWVVFFGEDVELLFEVFGCYCGGDVEDVVVCWFGVS